MKAKKIIIPGVAGTTVMTLFSYLLSELVKENFSEPEHLGTLIHRLAPRNSEEANQIAGWCTHYSVGLLFALIYNELWENGKIKPSFKNGFKMGGISGAAAIFIWKLTFKVHPAPPRINYKNYYIQLFAAHVVFAITATLTYRLIVKAKDTKIYDAFIHSLGYNVGSL